MAEVAGAHDLEHITVGGMDGRTWHENATHLRRGAPTAPRSVLVTSA